MKCPKCGNEVSQEEAFCGQCGTPNTLPARPTEMIDTSAPRSGLLSRYNTQAAPPSSPYNAMPPTPDLYNRLPNGPFAPPGQPQPSQPPAGPSSPQQAADFYNDATEAMSQVPGLNWNYPPQGQGFAGTSAPTGYPGTYGPSAYPPQPQPFQAGNYTNYPPPQTLHPGQGYGYGTQPAFPGLVTPPPAKKRNNTALLIACVCLVIAIFIATGFGVLYLSRSQSTQTGTATATTTIASTATAIPSPAPSPTTAPTPTATPVPSPTPSPTVVASPTPEPGFAFCDQTCTTNGFSVEYPSTWQQGSTSDNTGVQFANHSTPDTYAAFKVAGAIPASKTANDLVTNDLTTNFASQPGYVMPTSSQSTTIGGVTWVYEVAKYTVNSQTERIEVFATVRQGNGYVIELQAPDSQFDMTNTTFFEPMLGSFQFQ